jgi:hypothetical protein
MRKGSANFSRTKGKGAYAGFRDGVRMSALMQRIAPAPVMACVSEVISFSGKLSARERAGRRLART